MCNRGHTHHNVGNRSNWLLCYSFLAIALLVGGLGPCEAVLSTEEEQQETPVAKNGKAADDSPDAISDASPSRLLPGNDMDDVLLSMASYLPTVFEDVTDSPTSQHTFAPTTNNSDAPTHSPTLHPSPGPTTSDTTSTASPTTSVDSSGGNSRSLVGGVRGNDHLVPFLGTVLISFFFIVVCYY